MSRLFLGACLAVLAATSAAQLDTVEMIHRFRADAVSLTAFYSVDASPERALRLDEHDALWLERLAALEGASFDVQGRIDLIALRQELLHRRNSHARRLERLEIFEPWLPFAPAILDLERKRWDVSEVDARQAASDLAALAEAMDDLIDRVILLDDESADEASDEADVEDADDADKSDVEDALHTSPVLAQRVAENVDSLRGALATWHEHHSSYDPVFAWWLDGPYEKARDALEKYRDHLRKDIAGLHGEDDDPLIGDPIGRAALLADLRHEMIPYTPEEMLAIGEEQLAWCEGELKRAAADLGYTSATWRQDVLEHTKRDEVSPGEHDDSVVAQAREAIEFLDARDLVTIPELCRETWRLRMLSRGDQRTLPYGAYNRQHMLVAAPTRDMSHESKLAALRGNNVHFSRIVTPHELIPGHHLQRFIADRDRPYRSLFSTPFYVEGWALYWEMRLWDEGWAKTPENRVGMLFWRMHRAARIVVSLGFHLGQLTPDEMIELLVERVGHERDGATAEVRRYIGDSYSPLYQCGYLIGGLQIRALRRELRVGEPDSEWTDRRFHDAILAQNTLPIELIRAALTNTELPLDHEPSWKFDAR